MSVEAARAALEAVKAKQLAIDNELFALGRDEQRRQDAHGAAIALGKDTDASRAALDSVRSSIEDRKLAKRYLVTAISEAGAAYNDAVREAADATMAEQGAELKHAADQFDAALADVLKYRVAIIEAGRRMSAAAQSIGDSNPSRFLTELLVTETIRQVADGALAVPFSLLVASRIPEVLYE